MKGVKYHQKNRRQQTVSFRLTLLSVKPSAFPGPNGKSPVPTTHGLLFVSALDEAELRLFKLRSDLFCLFLRLT